ncbi:MAG: sulfotransferase domain-containing protein [Gammaproteobacteria bacterium]|nr:sulfotransferase domain-containing protein [Gammaproteobacteria bacterium]MDH5801376.1 sulfotransferase domain-containing protein [Gammaproteobacteria bacterium]
MLDPKWGSLSPMHDPRLLANFQPRSTDVLITTAPKTGTTWLQQILHQLKTGGDENFHAIGDVVPWLELPDPNKSWQQTLEEYEAMENPRLFKTHCNYEQTPGFGQVKCILTSRDPRDCCVSFYHHSRDLTDEARNQYDIIPPHSMEQFLAYWFRYPVWYHNVRSWWPYRAHPRLLWLRYEDLKRDLNKAIDSILAYLGWTLDGDKRERILQLCSFEWMKQNSIKFSRQNGDKPLFKPGGLIRQGEVGTSRQVLTTEQEQRILNKAYEYLPAECISFLGLPPPLSQLDLSHDIQLRARQSGI